MKQKELFIIQYIRALAVIMVIFVHSIEQIEWLKYFFSSKIGHHGVDLFFVVSGFIMVYTTHNKSITPVKFFWNRILRIVPLYWFLTISLLLIALIIPNATRSVAINFEHSIYSLFFIPQLSPVFPDKFWPTLIPGWTLNYEMAFYFLFAISLLLKEKLRLILILTVMLFFIWLGLFYSTSGLLKFYSDSIIIEFFLGMLLGYIYTNHNIKPNNLYASFLLFLSIFLWVYFEKIGIETRLFYAGIPAFLFVLGALQLNINGSSEIKSLHIVGNASYSIYLSHIFTLGLLRAIWNKLNIDVTPSLITALTLITIAIVLSVVIGVIIYELIEKRLNYKLRHKSH